MADLMDNRLLLVVTLKIPNWSLKSCNHIRLWSFLDSRT
jgi:hypothetical protein